MPIVSKVAKLLQLFPIELEFQLNLSKFTLIARENEMGTLHEWRWTLLAHIALEGSWRIRWRPVGDREVRPISPIQEDEGSPDKENPELPKSRLPRESGEKEETD